MAVHTIKGTYSLDVTTVRKLERMAEEWQVSKSEALRRAIREAADKVPSRSQRAIASLDRLQKTAALTKGGADAWVRWNREERRASSARAERTKP